MIIGLLPVKGEKVIMKWLIRESLGPIARRVGGQGAAAMVALGMAQQHEAAVAAAIAWGLLTVAEVVVSVKTRNTLVEKAKQQWGKN